MPSLALLAAILAPVVAPVVAPGALTASPAPRAVSAGSPDLKIAEIVPEGSIWDKSLRGLDREARACSGGKIGLKIYAGGVAGDEPDILRKMRIGQLHGGILSVAGLGEIDPAVQIFQIPLFFRSDEEAADVLRRMDGVFRARLEEKGFVLVHWCHAGWLDFFTTEPVRTVEDLKRLKQFVWAGDGRLTKWYEEAGFKPVPLAATDVLTGLKTGMIQSLPSTPLAALSLQWFRSAGHMLDYPVAPLYGALVVSKRAWKDLSEADRACFLAAGKKAEAFQFEEIPKQDREAVVEMQKRGLTVTQPSPERDAEPWLALSRQFADKMAQAWVPPEILEQVNGHLAELRGKKDGAQGAGETAGSR